MRAYLKPDIIRIRCFNVETYSNRGFQTRCRIRRAQDGEVNKSLEKLRNLLSVRWRWGICCQ